jgi:glycine oxidase
VKTWDIVVVGGGVIGLSLAWLLRKHGANVLVVEKGEPAREATHAAGGMLAYCDPHTSANLLLLATASARRYPEFVHELMDESGESPDLRDAGTLAVFENGEIPSCDNARLLTEPELAQLEPLLTLRQTVCFLPESSVDPRALGSALVKAAKHRGVDFVTGSPVIEVLVESGRAAGVRTTKSHYPAPFVINCAGAWAAQLQPFGPPTCPVKGQMVCVVPEPGSHHPGPLIEHVVRTPDIYIIPRSDGRILLGATVEDAGFDKHVDADTVHRLHQAAAKVAPVIGQMRILEVWAGLRPGSPDTLPILGETKLPGYFSATGHYRDGILLAPITAHLMTQLLTGKPTEFDLRPFSPLRFG